MSVRGVFAPHQAEIVDDILNLDEEFVVADKIFIKLKLAQICLAQRLDWNFRKRGLVVCFNLFYY